MLEGARNASRGDLNMKIKSKKEKIVYMLRTKPKYQFPLTDEERDELNYYVTKIYNPLLEENHRIAQERDKAQAEHHHRMARGKEKAEA